MIRWNKDYIKSGRKPIHQNFVVVNDDDDLISIHQTEEEAEVAKEKYLSENPERRAKVIENSRKNIKSSSRKIIKSSALPDEIYYIVVNGSKFFYKDKNELEEQCDYLYQTEGKKFNIYTENDPEEIEEVFEAGILKSSRKAIKSGYSDVEKALTELEDYFDTTSDGDTIYTHISHDDENHIAKVCEDYNVDFAVGSNYVTLYPIESSAGKKTNLPKNLVRQVLSNKITEDQAIRRVMVAQNCNRGVARVIFNRWMDQNRESLIKSDATIAEIQGGFNVDGNLDSWADDYMPGSGKANTKGGELVRAAQRIISAYYASEAMIGRGIGNEIVNPAARFIVETTNFELNSEIEEMLNHDVQYDNSEYDSWLKNFETKFEDYLRNNADLFSEPNDDDMDDYRDDSDKEFFLSKFYAEDDNGNEYVFEDSDGDWKCTDIVASSESAYEVGDEISDGDIFFDRITKNEQFGNFDDDGVTYFYESVGSEDENGDYQSFKITEVQFTDQLFEKDSFVDQEKLEELCEEGKLFDMNGNKIDIGDFMKL